MASTPEDVTIFCETMYGMGIGRCHGKLVEHGAGPVSFGEDGPYAKFVPPGKRRPRTLVARDKSYLLILRGSDYPDPPRPFIAREGKSHISALSPSGSDAVFERVYAFDEDSLRSFDTRYQAAFSEFIDAYAERFLADYRVPRDAAQLPRGTSSGAEQEASPQHTVPDVRAEAEPRDPEGLFDPGSLRDERRRALASKVLRPGQDRFREELMRAYEGRCTITGCDVPDALDAAHIIPYCGPRSDHVRNGLLLRLDLHALFDAHLLSIDPEELIVLVSDGLRGAYYEIIHGRRLRLPRSESLHPDREAIARHHEEFEELERNR